MVESVRRFVKSEHIACLHLVVLVLGTALMFSGCFHSAVWFDESYTVEPVLRRYAAHLGG